MWQYTDGAVGPEPHDIPGFGNCDRDMFNGTSVDLQTFWLPQPAILARTGT
jgi:lysozyme